MSPKPHTDACGLKQLPPTLYNNDRTATAGYSKVSRGLRVPLEFPGLCTRKKSSGDTSSGQWRSRYTIHASRHSIGKVLRSIYVTTSFKFLEADKTFLLVSTYRYMVRTVSSKFFRKKINESRNSTGKVLRYLKRVIVPPAVYQLFTPLKRSLKYWHWAGVAFYTKLYNLAEG